MLKGKDLIGKGLSSTIRNNVLERHESSAKVQKVPQCRLRSDERNMLVDSSDDEEEAGQEEQIVEALESDEKRLKELTAYSEMPQAHKDA